LKIVAREDINDAKWNSCVEQSQIQNPLIYSWSMDATTSKWCAVVNDDYSFIFPIPFEQQLNVKRARQQAFSRQVDYVGSQEDFYTALELLKKEFSEFDIRVSLTKGNFERQCFQSIKFESDYKYSTNAKRLIKKANEVISYEVSDDLDVLVSLYADNSFLKFKQPPSNIEKIKNSMKAYLENGKGYVLIAKEGEAAIGAAFFIEDKGTTYYLLGDSNEDHKKKGVIYGLMDFGIQKAQSKGMLNFDFGGSNIESVADFYKKFGAVDIYYTRVHWDKRPLWFKIIQKIKR